MIKIPYTILFAPDRDNTRCDWLLRCAVRWDGNRVYFNVGYRINKDKWSKEAQAPFSNTTHGKNKVNASRIVQEINRYKDAVSDAFKECEINNTIPTPEELRSLVNHKLGRVAVKNRTIFEYLDEFIIESARSNNWTYATVQKFTTLKKQLYDFNPEITFADLNNKGLNDLVMYYQTMHIGNQITKINGRAEHPVGMRNISIQKRISFLKWFLRWATSKGYNPEMAYLSFSPRLKQVDKPVIFLEWSELMKLYNFPLHTRSYSSVRDVFCFCCFTSLRYSDVANLKRWDIHDNYIEITTVKTHDSLKIDLNDYSREIINRYKDYQFPNDQALPIISNQKMNDYLKEICKLCEINTPIRITYYKGNERIDEVHPKWELMSTHAGRRTFICNALTFGISPQIVMKWTGHSDYKAMKPYIDIADSAKAQAMSLFNKSSESKKVEP